MPTDTADQAETARHALEEVSPAKNLDGIPRDYHPDFVDRVNRLTYHGHDGARRSVALYLELFPDLSFTVGTRSARATRWPRAGH